VIDPKLHTYVGRLGPTAHYLVTEYVENYEEGLLRRRDLLERVFGITGSAAAAAATLLALGVKPAHADPLASAPFTPPAQVPPQSPLHVPADDPAVVGTDTTVTGSDGAAILAYLARPNAAGRFPAVMICHENQGLHEHFKDVARRFAKAGYVAIALDMLSRRGGTDAVPENQRGMLMLGAAQQVADFQAAMAYLRRQPSVVADRIGMTGFCLGGGITWNTAIREPTLRAAVPFYGNPAFRDELGNIRAAVFGAYGEIDTNTTNTGVSLQPQLAAAGVTYRINVYQGAPHAFYNDTRPNTGNFGYYEPAALAAWQDVLAWFATYLRGAGLPQTGDGSGDGSGGEAGAEAEAVATEE
jgi:carboxymethylenebutenolidase